MIRIFAWIFVLAFNGSDKEPTDYLAPRGWQGNPWGPAATRARKDGTLPPIVTTPWMAKWDRWGRQVLRDGDIVFRLGDARLLYGQFAFSKFIALADNSPFSHTGIVAIEDGAPVVYDTTKAGVRRQPFQVWILDNVGPIGVKRLKARWRPQIPTVLSYCRRVFEEQVPFDFDLGEDDSALYCVEMTEKAFRSAGLTLSEPIMLGDMERAPNYPIRIMALLYLSRWTLNTPLSLDQPAFFPGNERHGIWSSSLLETVYAPPHQDASAKKKTERPKSDVARDGSGPARPTTGTNPTR